MRELEVSDSQAPRLPADNPVHPLLGMRVVVTHGPHKGYDSYIKDVGNTTISVELRVLFTSSMSPLQNFGWNQLRLM